MFNHGANCFCQFCSYSRSVQQQAQANLDPVRQEIRWNYPRIAEAADLGIVDQNLDDKVGMEP